MPRRLPFLLALLAACASPVLCQSGLHGTSLRDDRSRSSVEADNGLAALRDTDSFTFFLDDGLSGFAVYGTVAAKGAQPTVRDALLSASTCVRPPETYRASMLLFDIIQDNVTAYGMSDAETTEPFPSWLVEINNVLLEAFAVLMIALLVQLCVECVTIHIALWALVVAYMVLALRAGCAQRAATNASAVAAADFAMLMVMWALAFAYMVLTSRADCAKRAATDASAAAAADRAKRAAADAGAAAAADYAKRAAIDACAAAAADCAKRAADASAAATAGRAERAAVDASAADTAHRTKRAAIDASAAAVAGVAVTNGSIGCDFVAKCSHCLGCFGWPTAAATAACPYCCKMEARTVVEQAAASFGAACVQRDRYKRDASDAGAAAERYAAASAAEAMKRAAAEARATAAEARVAAVERAAAAANRAAHAAKCAATASAAEAMRRATAETRTAAAEARADAVEREAMKRAAAETRAAAAEARATAAEQATAAAERATDDANRIAHAATARVAAGAVPVAQVDVLSNDDGFFEVQDQYDDDDEIEVQDQSDDGSVDSQYDEDDLEVQDQSDGESIVDTQDLQRQSDYEGAAGAEALLQPYQALLQPYRARWAMQALQRQARRTLCLDDTEEDFVPWSPLRFAELSDDDDLVMDDDPADPPPSPEQSRTASPKHRGWRWQWQWA